MGELGQVTIVPRRRCGIAKGVRRRGGAIHRVEAVGTALQHFLEFDEC